MSLTALVIAPVQRVVVRAAAYLSGELLATLSPLDGSVTADARRGVMRDASLDLAPTDALGLEEQYELLTTPGVELAIWRGLIDDDGAEQLAALGRFVADEPMLVRGSSGLALSVSLSDVSVRIARARWSEPWVVEAGTPLADALNELLTDRYPGVLTRIDAESCPETVGVKVVTEPGEASDPWEDAGSIAAAYGYALYADVEGYASVRQVPLPTPGAAVFTFARGLTATATGCEHSVLIGELENGVVASAEGSDVETPLRGEAWDDDPASPTYYLGPFGRVPRFYSSPLLTTVEQCEQAAATMLAGLLGRSEQLSWLAAVNPWLQPYDVIGSERSDGEIDYHVLDEVTVPLAPSGEMTATARTVRGGW